MKNKSDIVAKNLKPGMVIGRIGPDKSKEIFLVWNIVHLDDQKMEVCYYPHNFPGDGRYIGVFKTDEKLIVYHAGKREKFLSAILKDIQERERRAKEEKDTVYMLLHPQC